MIIAVLASGSGTNLQALIDTLHVADSEPVRIGLVLSDRPSAGALRRAREAGIPTAVVSARKYPTRDAFDDAIVATLDAHDVELVVDRDVWKAKAFQCHPLVNTSTLVVPKAHIERFLEATGHEARVASVPGRR